MFDLLSTIFTPGYFEPHSAHFANNPELMWVIATMNLLIGVCYLLIPIELSYVYFKRRDFPFSWVFIVIAFFGVWCSMTHFMNVIVFWYPAYWLEGIINLTTGTVSLVSFVGYAIAVPLILNLTSPQKLQEINMKLSEEIENRKKIEQALTEKTLDYERVSKDLIKKNSELARMNGAMVERELKMVDLKKTIELLKIQ